MPLSDDIRMFAATDVGQRRPHNEDSFLVDPDLGVCIVADGMGGHAAGEVASATVELAGGMTRAPAPGSWALSVDVSSPDAQIRGFAAPLEAHLSMDESELSLSDVRVGGFAEGDVRVGLTGEQELAAGFVVSEAQLREVMAAFTDEVPDGVSGLVFASVSANVRRRALTACQVQHRRANGGMSGHAAA